MTKRKMQSFQTNNSSRMLFSQNNTTNGVTLICIGGIHGNEPAGVYGLQKIIRRIKNKNITLNGNFYALLGNENAFNKKVRFQDLDLNRLWTKQDIESLNNTTYLKLEEHKEQYELYSAIKTIINSHTGLFVFVDLHTTSSPSIPFITISDSINNRSLGSHFNIPIVLGIEEYLDGPLLSYINEFGHVSLGFEAGQHQDEKASLYCEAFVWLIMEKLGLITKNRIPFETYNNALNFNKGFYEIIYRHSLTKTDDFKMDSGFNNFNPVSKNKVLAQDGFKVIKSPFSGYIFMPLYQKQGEDGFFIVKKISKRWLVLSSVLRGLQFHQLLRILPGISEHPENEYCLIADKHIAKFLTTKVFHLFGYRKKIVINDTIHFIKRDRKISPFV